MNRIQYVAPVPDHVTRYTHKANRWMTPPKPYRKTTAAEIIENAVTVLAICGLIVTAVFLLQAV